MSTTSFYVWFSLLDDPSALEYLPSATKLRRLCFYRRVSVHRGEYLTRYTPRTRYTPWDQVHPPGPDTPPPRPGMPQDQVHPQGPGTPPPPGRPGTPPPPPPRTRYTPPCRDTATAADGRHPTGMHSCYA